MPRFPDIRRRFSGPEKPEYWLQSELRLVVSFFDKICADHPPRIDIFKELLQSKGSIKSFKSLFTDANQVIVSQLRIFESVADTILNQDMALAFCRFLGRLENPDCRAWLTAGSVAWPAGADVTELHQLCAEPGFDVFSQRVTFSTVSNFVRLIVKDRKGAQAQSDARFGLINFIRMYPEQLERIIAVYERYPNWRLMSWKETLNALYTLMETMGDDPLITDDDLNQVVSHYWTPETIEEQSLKASFHHLPESKRQTVYSRLRNSLSLSETRNLRSFLSEHLPESQRTERLRDRRQLLETIALIENPFHPWHDISPTMGVEIEASLPKKEAHLQPLLLSLASINHFMGDGGANAPLEISPGPFRTAVTLNAIHQAWIDSGWLDLHTEKMQTLHQNVGLLDEQTLINLNGMILSCAEVYRPVSTKPPVDFFRLCILYNRAEQGQMYMETKGFSVINSADLRSHTTRYALLATAANCYEKLHGASSVNLASMYGKVDIKPTEKISIYMRQLEKIWVSTVKKMNMVYEYFGVGYLDSTEKPSLNQINQILKVFPQIEDHFDADLRLKSVREPKRNSFRIKYGATANLPYDNLVQAARVITDQACIEIEAVMMKMQEDFVRYVLLFANPKTNQQFWLPREFDKLFPTYRDRISNKNLVSRIVPLLKPFLRSGSTLPRPV